MPHAKSDEGSYNVILIAYEVTAGKDQMYFEENFNIKVTDNLYTAFKT
jgi:hypothetical protein